MRTRLDSPGWWALATFLIPVSQAVAQLVVAVLDAKGVVTGSAGHRGVATGVLAGLAAVLWLLPWRVARAGAIGAAGMLVVYLVGWMVHGLS
ncbi:hypothetical protein [Nocardia sp. NPDC004722]